MESLAEMAACHSNTSRAELTDLDQQTDHSSGSDYFSQADIESEDYDTTLTMSEETDDLPAAEEELSVELFSKKLLEDLQYAPNVVAEDCAHILEMRERKIILSHCHLHSIVGEERLRAWLREIRSAVLAVECGGAWIQDSASSYVAAQIVRCLLTASAKPTNSSILVAAYFCGRHYRERDEGVFTSPSGMALSIMLQVFEAARGTICMECLLKCTKGLDPHSVGSVCDVLERLIDTLDCSQRLFVVLDNTTFFYHPEDRRNGAVELVNRLVACQRRSVESDSAKAVVKLLLMTPCGPLLVNKTAITYSERLSIQRNTPYTRPFGDEDMQSFLAELKEDSNQQAEDSHG